MTVHPRVHPSIINVCELKGSSLNAHPLSLPLHLKPIGPSSSPLIPHGGGSQALGPHGPQSLGQQEGLHHLFCLLRRGVDVLQGVSHRKLPVPQSVPVGEDVVVLKHLLIVPQRVVELDEAAVVVLQATVALAKQLLPCAATTDDNVGQRVHRVAITPFCMKLNRPFSQQEQRKCSSQH